MVRRIANVVAVVVIFGAATSDAFARDQQQRTDEVACSYICTTTCPSLERQGDACAVLAPGCQLDQTCRAGHTNCSSGQQEFRCYIGA